MTTSTGLRLVFAGTPDFAAHHLKALLADGKHQIVAVYTQPDRPSGRGKKLTGSPVKAVAVEHNIPVFQPLNFKTDTSQQELAGLHADLMIVVAYGIILPKVILDTPRLGCINVHASLLPRWRGAAPIQRAIAAGDTESGVTIMQMNEGLDTGDMLVKAHIPLTTDETGGSLHDKLAGIGAPALLQTLHELHNNSAVAEVQDNNFANYAHKLSKQEAVIDWSKPAIEIERTIRAFNPFPVASADLNNKRLRIWSAAIPIQQSEDSAINPATNTLPGTILSADDRGISVACGEGTLCISELQLPGKKRLAVADILRGQATLFTPGNKFL